MTATFPYRTLMPALLTLLLIAACSEPQPAVNRVQANTVEKRVFLDSEWYAKKTVIDTPYTSSATFVGEGSTVHKIVWDIQEHFLIARRTHQHIDGSEDTGIAGPGINQTPVVAMYAIEKHFDIRRAYNTVTGEEQNVIEENDFDRHWYEREYMRVDWSKNLISDEDLSLTSSLGGVTLEPVSYFVQEPSHPFAPKFEKDEAGEVYYIDIVNKYFAVPEMVEVGRWGMIPSCYLIANMHVDCQPGEIAVRNAFLRVDPEHDYEPMVYTEDRMDRFGYFLTTRDTYDRSYGTTAAGRTRFVNRHNIWEQSHRRDASGLFIPCRDDADCGDDGSICDLALARARRSARGACTIPYRERTVKPIAFHLSRDFPPDLIPPARAMADGFNRAFSETVGSLRELECREAGGEDCEAWRDTADGAEVFVLCHSPVAPLDPEACGPEGTIAEIGDLRYNLLAWVPEPNFASPLGYGPSFADPETGEILSAGSFIYGAALEVLTAQARDLLALMNGDLEEDAITSNEAFGAWMRRMRSGAGGEAGAGAREAHRHVIELDGLDAGRINRAMSFDWIRQLVDADEQSSLPLTRENLVGRFGAARERLLRSTSELRFGDHGRAQLAGIRGTDIEHLLLDDEMVFAAGFGPGTPLTDEVIEAASPLRGMSAPRLRAITDLQRRLALERNTCLLHGDFVDEGLLGLVQELNRAVRERDGVIEWYGVEHRIGSSRGIDYRLVEEMLRYPIFNALAAHEVGHTVGLRHNFSGSYDALNYHKRYWELRNDGNMLPRAWDPLTTAEINGRIHEYQYSSVMDYGHNFVVTAAEGLGKYDAAAIKMGYGDLVEVFTDVPEQNRTLIAEINALQGFGWPGALDLDSVSTGNLRMIPYTELPALVGGIEGLERRANVRFTSLGAPAAVARSVGNVPTVDEQGRPAVPYRYCGDEFADFQPGCLRYDAGADEYETLSSLADAYWNYYLFNNFMRQRLGFDPDNVPSRIYSRYFSKFESANLYYSFFRGVLAQLGATGDFFERVDGFGAFTAGVGVAYQMLNRVLATPEPGFHAPMTTPEGEPYLGLDQSGLGFRGVEVDRFDGRGLRTTFSLGPDQSFWYLTRAGFFQDKALAMEVLLNPGVRVLGQDTNADLRQFQISFYTTFQEPVKNALRGAIGREWSAFAPRWVNGRLVYPAADQQLDGSAMAEGTMVEPNFGFSLQLYAMVYAMTLAPRTFDQSVVHRSRLFARGGAESVDLELPEEEGMIEFLDEDSGLVFMAPSYPDEEGRETGISAQMLIHAQALKDEGRSVQLKAWMSNLNVLRRLTWLAGFGGDEREFTPRNRSF